MGVYNLNNPQDLEYDFNEIVNRINLIYEVHIEGGLITTIPKLTDKSNAFWASEENSEHFNRNIPTFKSLHKDMYAYIEAIARIKFGKYERSYFENKYEDFNEFRELNNFIKHSNPKSVEISFTKIVHMNPKIFDLMCNFKYPDKFKCLMYSSFVVMFVTILNDLGVIKIN